MFVHPQIRHEKNFRDHSATSFLQKGASDFLQNIGAPFFIKKMYSYGLQKFENIFLFINIQNAMSVIYVNSVVIF